MSSRRVLFVSLVVMTFGVSPAHGEPQSKDGYWRFAPRAQHHDSIVQVNIDESVGTGVLVHVDRDKPAKGGYEGYVLTAAHMLDFDLQTRGIKVTYPNGRRAKGCKVRHMDKDNDIALLWVWVPEQCEPATFADKQAVRGDALEFSGLGGGVPLDSLRNFKAVASDPTDDNMIYADVSLLPGDSGGPIFRDGQLVGIISGGWFWWDDQRRQSEEGPRQITWPARAANLSAIKSLFDRRKDSKSEVLASAEIASPR